VNDANATEQHVDRSAIAARAREIRAAVARRALGQDEHIESLLCCVMAGRHALVEGVPGLGKTVLVKALADSLGCRFRRIQFTPDLLPADILGSYVYQPGDGSFVLRRGPVFANVILADEINRAPAKTQSALLEVMQERQVTIEGETLHLDPPFFVFATQNPVEHEGVYPLPQAQLDRFGMRLLIDYPAREDEIRILQLHHHDPPEVPSILSPGEIAAWRRSMESIAVSEVMTGLVVRILEATRDRSGVMLGASTRAGLDLIHLARARALLHDRDYIIPDDIKALLVPVTNHRIQLTPELEISGLSVVDLLNDVLRDTELV
jgi:MoxR-like ATPase